MLESCRIFRGCIVFCWCWMTEELGTCAMSAIQDHSRKFSWYLCFKNSVSDHDQWPRLHSISAKKDRHTSVLVSSPLGLFNSWKRTNGCPHIYRFAAITSMHVAYMVSEGFSKLHRLAGRRWLGSITANEFAGWWISSSSASRWSTKISFHPLGCPIAIGSLTSRCTKGVLVLQLYHTTALHIALRYFTRHMRWPGCQ